MEIKGDTKNTWHKLTEDADPKRFIVLSDKVGHISPRLRWPIAEFVRNSKKKNGIIYTKWAYQDDIYSMREIKFRGYNQKNGHWLHGFYLQNRGNHFVCPDEFANGKDWDDYEILPDTLGQYTGLKDKKGQEIYEGDVFCRYDIWIDTPQAVVYRDGQWIGVAHDGTWLALLQDTDSICEVLRYIEVIGNTHDNPETMKAKECNCCKCGKQAVAFYPCIDPDIPSYPYCADCLYDAMIELSKVLWKDDKGMQLIAREQAKKAVEKYKQNK